MISTIAPQHFRTLKLASDAIVIDVRDVKEQYEEGQIPGNLRFEMNSSDFEEQIRKLDKNSRYLVYCRSGNRSMQVCRMMEKMGFDQVYSLDGGIMKWKETFS